MSELISRATIDDVERRRAYALERYAIAFDALADAFEAGAEAVQHKRGNGPRAAAERLLTKDDHLPYSCADPRAFFMEAVRKNLDRKVWTFLIDFMGLERIMDRTARDQFREQLREHPPEATAENCYATFSTLIGDAGTIFQRGVALAFSGLDRRFRSHDGFKIGSRIVLSNALSDWGSWSRSQDEVLRDVERAFYQLDGGKPQPERAGGIIGTWEIARRDAGSTLSRQAFEAEDEYFLIRSFKNGNVHLWFKRKDLVEKVNLLLAEYYGAGLGVGPDAAEPQHRNAVGPAKNFGLFETPEPIARRLLEDAGVHTPETYTGRGYTKLRVLEPSAGRGRIALPAHTAGHNVICVEIQPELARGLRSAGLQVIQGDFLEVRGAFGEFDAVAMNPPFDRGRDIDHVLHALRFLKPGGKLAAIMAAGVEFREDRKTVAFRTLVERMGGRFRDLPAGSFIESGTNVNTVILTLTKGSAV